MSVFLQPWFWSAVLALALSAPAAADLGLEIGVEHFVWREFDEQGRILKESGPRYRLGAYWRQAFGEEARDSVQVRTALYFGEVDYDGQAQNVSTGARSPFQTEADYGGVLAEATYSHRLGSASRAAELFAGGGIDSWRRDVRGRDGVAGAIEDWTVFYLLGGGGGDWRWRRAALRAHAGLKYPLYTHEVPDAFDVVLEPKGRISAFARIATDFFVSGRPRWGFGFYYDSYRFDRSDTERSGSFLIWQPESRQDTFGAYGTYYFR